MAGEGGAREEKAGPGFYISNDRKPLEGSEQDKAQSDFYVEGSLWLLLCGEAVRGEGLSVEMC